MAQANYPKKYSAVTKVPLGTTIRTKLVQRCDVADGTQGRVIPIFDNAVYIKCFFSEEPKGMFLCSQEEALTLGINPIDYAVIPVFRLNTDTKANVLDDNIKLEYLRMGTTAYEQLALSMQEQDMTSLVITKEKSGTYSYVKATLSARESLIPEDVRRKTDEMRQSLNEDQIFQMVITDFARPFEDYLRLTNQTHLFRKDVSQESRPKQESKPARNTPTAPVNQAPNFSDMPFPEPPVGTISTEFTDEFDEFEEDFQS